MSIQLSGSADERSVEPSLEARSVGPHAEQPVGDERLRLALGLDGVDTFELERPLCKLPRRVPDEDLAGLCGLLEASGDVDGVARRECATLARHDLAGVHPDPYLQLGSELALEPRIEAGEPFAQLVRRFTDRWHPGGFPLEKIMRGHPIDVGYFFDVQTPDGFRERGRGPPGCATA